MGIDGKLGMSGLDRMVAPTNAAWLPDSSLVESWSKLFHAPSEGHVPLIVERTEKTRCTRQPELHFYLRLPSDAGEGKPVSGVLAFCTWERDQAAILSKLSIDLKTKQENLPGPVAEVARLVGYAEEHHMALLTWDTVQTWDIHANTEDLKRKQEAEFDHNFDLLAAAWERGVNELAGQYSLPEKNYLLYVFPRRPRAYPEQLRCADTRRKKSPLVADYWRAGIWLRARQTILC
jgi:hypothetical protein